MPTGWYKNFYTGLGALKTAYLVLVIDIPYENTTYIVIFNIKDNYNLKQFVICFRMTEICFENFNLMEKLLAESNPDIHRIMNILNENFETKRRFLINYDERLENFKVKLNKYFADCKKSIK